MSEVAISGGYLKIALTRDVTPEIVNCELTFLERRPIKPLKALRQHAAYREALTKLGLVVINLPNPQRLPDAVFVEDPAIVLDEVAVITRMGTARRQEEVESFAEVLAQYRLLKRIQAPASLEGGDVLQIGKTLFVGLSGRTNIYGVEQLSIISKYFGYTTITSKVLGCLHFKTGCSYLGDNTVLVNPAWVKADLFRDYRVLCVAPEEAFAANAILISSTVLYPDCFPKTQALLEKQGFKLELVDISELMKAEAGLTCMSQIFNS